MEREYGSFDGESGKKAEKEQQRLRGRDDYTAGSEAAQYVSVIEAARNTVYIDDGTQHQHGTEHREDEKLHSRITAPA